MAEQRDGSAPEPMVLELGERRFELDALAHLNRMNVLGLVLPNVAHEVNNALQVVSGLIEMTAARPELPPDVREKLDRMASQAGRASLLVRELVTFSRRDHASVSTLDVRKVVDAALALRRYHLSRDRVAVSVHVPPHPCLSRLDGHYLQQVIINLIVNAEQAVHGKDTPSLSVSVLPEGEQVAILVEDNGGGLSGEASARAGQPFFSTQSPEALGLGLAVSRALVERQGGTLTLEAAERGTRVRVTLPSGVAAT